jgi:hypothetical protein
MNVILKLFENSLRDSYSVQNSTEIIIFLIEIKHLSMCYWGTPFLPFLFESDIAIAVKKMCFGYVIDFL